MILIFQLQSSEWQWRLNAEWTMNALWTIGERTVSERWTLCERWTRANGERWTQNCERWTHDERTLNARWTDGERTVNERKNGKVERFRDCNHQCDPISWSILTWQELVFNLLYLPSGFFFTTFAPVTAIALHCFSCKKKTRGQWVIWLTCEIFSRANFVYGSGSS